MIIAQITDPHLRAEGTRLFGAVDTFGALQRAIDHLNASDPGPDAVIVTGDLVHDGEAEDYAALTGLLRRLRAPVFAVPGNHDRRELTRKALAFTGVMPDAGPIRFAANASPVRLIGLDSLVEGHEHGHLDGDQLAWLDDQLAASPDSPTLVFLHHPPFATGIGFMDAIGLDDADALAAVIGRHGHVGLIACGHVHRMIVNRLGSVPVVVGPGVAHHVVLDLTAEAPSRWIAEPSAYLLHRWSAQSGFVTHQVFVDDYGAATPFSKQHPRFDRQQQSTDPS
ncbi:MAG: phosphodiesterase [Hyphomicrobiales bacterium]|nr:phosphodiesterase [Hyphomicrobiales bacterium]